MAVAFHSDSIEIQEEDDNDDVDKATPEDDVQYENVETRTSAGKHPLKKSVIGRYKLVVLVVGLLCGVQALLNIGLRMSLFSEPIKEINNLTNLNNLTKVLDHLQSKYNNLTKDQDHLQSKYDNLTKDLEQMTKQKDVLQSRYNNVTELKKKFCELSGWQTFGRGCYYYSSTEGKTWELSRQYCRANQSDLIIINSKEEQDFVNRGVNSGQVVWLGLTDREEEGVWKWVDGTPLTSTPTYWNPGEPNGGRREDCAVHQSGYEWNDLSCTNTRPWMCEKAL